MLFPPCFLAQKRRCHKNSWPTRGLPPKAKGSPRFQPAGGRSSVVGAGQAILPLKGRPGVRAEEVRHVVPGRLGGATRLGLLLFVCVRAALVI